MPVNWRILIDPNLNKQSAKLPNKYTDDKNIQQLVPEEPYIRVNTNEEIIFFESSHEVGRDEPIIAISDKCAKTLPNGTPIQWQPATEADFKFYVKANDIVRRYRIGGLCIALLGVLAQIVLKMGDLDAGLSANWTATVTPRWLIIVLNLSYYLLTAIGLILLFRKDSAKG